MTQTMTKEQFVELLRPLAQALQGLDVDAADAAAKARQVVVAQRRGVPPEHGNEAAGRLDRQEQQPEEAALACAGRADQRRE